MNVKSMKADVVTMELTRDEVDMLDNVLQYFKEHNMPRDEEDKATVESLSRGMFVVFMKMSRARGVGGVE